jgi:uncharacterized repeat protein (TIGR03803 family)
MQCKKCLRTLASALIIAAAALVFAGAARARTYKIIHEFEVLQQPTGNLTMDANGNLYGVTTYGGSAECTFGPGGCGVIWKLAPNGILTILHKFTGADGANPFRAGVIFDAAGNLYGTTSQGGSGACTDGCGVVFKLVPKPDGTWTESVLHTFTGGSDGANPYAGLIFDAAGNLYGTTQDGGDSTSCPFVGCGIAFKLAPKPDGTWTESVLYSFAGGADGGGSNGALIFDAAGNLYGTTVDGGADNSGVVFKLTPNSDGTWTESVLHSFAGADGIAPYDGPVLDATGNLYGTTWAGGAHGSGLVFKLAPSPHGTWTETVLHSFTGGADGANPAAGLTFDAAGNLYGTAWDGGATHACTPYGEGPGCGVVFKLTPTSAGWSYTALRKFLGVANNPEAPVIFDSKGNLYGTTRYGTGNNGVVFKITP